MIELLWCDGTWTAPAARSAASEALRRSLDPRLVRFRYVDYPGSFGPATGLGDISPAESIEIGAHNVEREVLAAADRGVPHIVIGGYSQGAMAALRAAVRPAVTQQRSVDAVATLGDPHQPIHHGRSGIAGTVAVPMRRLAIYAPGDPIADLPLGSPLRSIADLTEWMSIRDLESGRRWARKSLQRLATQRAQAWWAPWRWPDIASAVQYANNYLHGTQHTLDYRDHGHAARLARMIEGVAR